MYFYRGQFCGLRIPGAPWVPGCNAANTDLVMAALLDNYPRAVQLDFLKQYAQAGYTHLQRSIGHSLYYGGTLDTHIDLSKRAQGQFGLFADEWFLGGEALMDRDRDVEYWRPILDPIIDTLLKARAIDTACVGWQLDQYCAPGNSLIGIIAYVAEALPWYIPLYTHWVNEALAWWKTGGEVWEDKYQSLNVTNRFSWWKAMGPYLTGGHHQGNVTMARTNLKLYQDKMKDTLNPFTEGRMGMSYRDLIGPRNFALTVFECTAQDQFDGRCSEDEGDLIGYLLMCTVGDSGGTLRGYGHGARRPDGTRL